MKLTLQARDRWPALAAMVTMLALLWAFNRVVEMSVQQGALRKAAERSRSDAMWRCNTLAERQARADCRLALP